jgi:hypothetical protein
LKDFSCHVSEGFGNVDSGAIVEQDKAVRGLVTELPPSSRQRTEH